MESAEAYRALSGVFLAFALLASGKQKAAQLLFICDPVLALDICSALCQALVDAEQTLATTSGMKEGRNLLLLSCTLLSPELTCQSSSASALPPRVGA